MTTELLVILAGLAFGLLMAAIVFLLVYWPMRRLFDVNLTLESARSFYARTFVIVLLLVVWAGVMSMDLSAAKAAATQPASARDQFMEIVWGVADNLEGLLWPIAVVLGVYVALVTVVFSAVGRDRG